MSCSIPKGTFPFYVFSVIAFTCFYVAPGKFDLLFNIYCAIQYIISIVYYDSFIKKKNYLDFDSFFFISYFFVFFIYPVFIYPVDPECSIMFTFRFEHSLISKGTAMALLGSQMFLLGSICCHFKMQKIRINRIKHMCLPLNFLHSITILLFILFISLGGYSYFKNLYSNGGNATTGVFAYFLILFIAFFTISIVLEYNRISMYKEISFLRKTDKFFLIFSFLVAIILLSSGTRAIVLQILLSFAGLYSVYFKNVSFKKIAVIFFSGSIFMSYLSFIRVQNGEVAEDFLDLFMDLIINSRSSYVALSYVDENGITWGRSMLGYLLKPIPFLQGFVCDVFNVSPNEITSSKIITVDALGDSPTLGLGTNIIADLYISFGIVGVCVFMYFLGYIVRKSYLLAKLGSIYYMLLYTVLFSLSVYMVRSEFFYGLNIWLWGFCIINIHMHYHRNNTSLI